MHPPWLGLGSPHGVAGGLSAATQRNAPLAGTGLAAGSPHFPFPGPPVHHTGSDVHYGCPGHPSSPLEGGLPLEVPVSWGRGRSPLLLLRSTGDVVGDKGVSGCLEQWTFCAALPTPSPRSVVGEIGNIVPNHQGRDGLLFYLFDLKPGHQPPDLPA